MLVSEIPFDPEKGLEGLEMLRNKNTLKGGSSIRFAVARRKDNRRNGKVWVETYVGQPCHGRLQGSGMFEMCATGINPGQMDGMHEYFVKDSPFSRFILNRDTYNKDGFIAVTGDLWYPFQNCLNIFCRQSAEGYGAYMQPQFDDFISRGVPPLLALLIVTSTTMFRDNLKPTTNVAFRSGHSLVSSLTVEGLRNFLATDAVGYVADSDNRPAVKPTNYYNGIFTWEKDRKFPSSGTDWLSVIFNARKTEILKGRGVKRSLSPFEMNNNANYPAIRRNEFNDHALPFLLDVYYSVNGKDRIPTPARPTGEIVRQACDGVVDAVQEYGHAFARAVGIRD